MSPDDLTALDVATTRDRLRAGTVSALALAEASLARIAALDARLGAFLTVDAPGALAAAAALDARLAQGDRLDDLPLAGVTVAVKDAFCTDGLRTTCGSRMLEGFVPPYDATAVARLRSAGAIVVGKANMDEFSMGSSTERSAFFPARNPWNLAHTPGGSSGGVAAAVSARLAAVGLGSDTGGSVRQPAALTGLVGLKPTYGRVSRYGLVAFASSLDVVSPIARTVADCAALYAVLAGPDPRDATCHQGPVDPPSLGRPGALLGLRVGVPAEYLGEGVEASVRDRVHEALGAMEAAGAVLVPLSMPSTAEALASYYVLCPAEASSNLARYDGVRYGLRVEGPGPRADLRAMVEATRRAGFGPEVQRRIVLGTFVLSAGQFDAYYAQAVRARGRIAAEFAAVFASVDVLAAPTAPTEAFALGAHLDDPVAMYRADVCTLPASLAGVPAASVPVGLGAAGLPVGLQLMAPAYAEARLLEICYAVEALVGRVHPPEP